MYFRKSMYLFLEKEDKKISFFFFSPRKVLGTFSWRSILKFIDSFESIQKVSILERKRIQVREKEKKRKIQLMIF